MATQSPQLRVIHTGESKGSLYLADLDDEENNQDSSKIQVYIPEGGTVDLPLNDRVLNSYNQGTIRGFADAGLVNTSIIHTGESFDPGYEEFTYSSDHKPSKATTWRSSTKDTKDTETDFTYDAEEQLTEVTQKQFDDDGDVVRTVETTFTRDNRGRITSADTTEI